MRLLSSSGSSLERPERGARDAIIRRRRKWAADATASCSVCRLCIASFLLNLEADAARRWIGREEPTDLEDDGSDERPEADDGLLLRLSVDFADRSERAVPWTDFSS